MAQNRILEAWKRGGFALAADVVANRAIDRFREMRLGSRTDGLVPIETLIEDWTDRHDYFPTSFRTFAKLMSHVDVDPRRDSFADVGSGKGRVLIMAAGYSFRRVYGYEIAEDLNRIARENLDRCRDRLRCRDVMIVQGDAAVTMPPADATVFYLYNPCHGDQLRRIIGNIGLSVTRFPREVTVLFNNTRHFAAMEGEFPWLRPLARLSFEHDCAVYAVSGPP